MKSIFVYYQLTYIIINYHQQHQLSLVDVWRATNWCYTHYSIYRQVRRRSYYFLYITSITYTRIITYIMLICVMRIISTCMKAITITLIIIIHYFRKNSGNLSGYSWFPFMGNSWGKKRGYFRWWKKKKSNGCESKHLFLLSESLGSKF